jgi:hypothetical protein
MAMRAASLRDHRLAAWVGAAAAFCIGAMMLACIRLPYAHKLYAAQEAICIMQRSFASSCVSAPPSEGVVVTGGVVAALTSYAAMAIPPLFLALEGRKRSFCLPLMVPAVMVSLSSELSRDTRELLAGWPATFGGSIRYTSFRWTEPFATQHEVVAVGLVLLLALLPALVIVAIGPSPSRPTSQSEPLSVRVGAVLACVLAALMVFSVGSMNWPGLGWISYGWLLPGTWFSAAVATFVFGLLLDRGGKRRYLKLLTVALLMSGWFGGLMAPIFEDTQVPSAAGVLRASFVLLAVGAIGLAKGSAEELVVSLRTGMAGTPSSSRRSARWG